MTNEQLEILCVIRAGRRTFRGIAEAMGLDYHSGVHKQLETLRQAGLVEHTVDAAATLRLTEAGRQAVEGYFLTYKAGGGVELERMVRRYDAIPDINPGLTGRTGPALDRYVVNVTRCRRKRFFPTKAKARKARREWGGRCGAMNIYHCKYCGGFHLGSRD